MSRGEDAAENTLGKVWRVAVALATLTGWSYAIAVYASSDVRSAFAAHLDQVERDRKVMDAFAKGALERLDALCRANPKADCPRGLPLPP